MSECKQGNCDRNAILDEAKIAVWKAIDPSDEGVARQCADDAMAALEAMKTERSTS